MKIRLMHFMVIAMVAGLIVSCNSLKDSKDSNLAPGVHKVIAEEVIQGSSYTYVRVSSEGKDYWIAIERSDVKQNETYYWSKGGEMKEFTSKELKRTFRSIFFVEDFTDKPITLEARNKQLQKMSMAGKQKAPQTPGISVPRAQGGITIAELYAKKNECAGKSVRISGQVVRFAGDIMKKNWIHIQDGTKNGENYDLTATTQDVVAVGDVITIEGVVALDKNIGAGYFYDILVEDVKLKK